MEKEDTSFRESIPAKEQLEVTAISGNIYIVLFAYKVYLLQKATRLKKNFIDLTMIVY